MGCDALAIWAAGVCSRAARYYQNRFDNNMYRTYRPIRLRHIGKTDPQCGTVRFCFRSGSFTCSACTGFRAVTTPLQQVVKVIYHKIASPPRHVLVQLHIRRTTAVCTPFNTWPGSLGHTRLPHKRHLDRFIRFCRAHRYAQVSAQHRHTQRYTGRSWTCNMCSSRPHL